MKKIYFAIAVLATALLASCEREQSFNELPPLGENGVGFTINGLSTKSGAVSKNAVKGVTIPLGKVSTGESLYLEETIEEMNPNPGTKGAPAYTVNVGKMYTSLGVYASYTAGFGTAETAFGLDPNQMEYEHQASHDNYTNGWRYCNYYANNPWPSNPDTPVDFYLRMPVTEDVTDLTYADQATSFKLTSPQDGADQQDLLFGQTTISKNDHDGYGANGAPVIMYHALSAVKFRNGHPNDNPTKTIITRVEIIGLDGYGECSISANGTATWTNTGTPSTEASPFYLDFDNPEYVKATGAGNPDGTVGSGDGYDTDHQWNSDLVGTSWTASAADKNLNDKDGSLTFWFIPQVMTDDVILKVYFTVKTPDSVDGFLTDACHTIELGKLVNAGRTGTNRITWGAGQLRTYTLMPYDVDVDIKDVMSDENTKEDLHIANTGNVDEYVRMLIMGNWYGWESVDEMNSGVDPSILVGYKYQLTEPNLTDAQKKEMILPWFREGYDLDNNPNTPKVDPYGHFDSSFTLASLGDASEETDRNGKRDDWADASGGFYYTMPIGPGEGVGANVASATKDLFESYTVTSVPTIYLATSATTRVPAVGVHLRMEIVVQSIAVPKDTNGDPVWWLQAWYDATGVDKLNPELERNEDFVYLYEHGEYDPE